MPPAVKVRALNEVVVAGRVYRERWSEGRSHTVLDAFDQRDTVLLHRLELLNDRLDLWPGSPD